MQRWWAAPGCAGDLVDSHTFCEVMLASIGAISSDTERLSGGTARRSPPTDPPVRRTTELSREQKCTVCKTHGTALTLGNFAHAPTNRSSWSHAGLKSHREFLAANRYRDLKVPSQPAVRSTILGSLQDVTTWALTHFEPVRSWSVAEDFTSLRTRRQDAA